MTKKPLKNVLAEHLEPCLSRRVAWFWYFEKPTFLTIKHGLSWARYNTICKYNFPQHITLNPVHNLVYQFIFCDCTVFDSFAITMVSRDKCMFTFTKDLYISFLSDVPHSHVAETSVCAFDTYSIVQFTCHSEVNLMKNPGKHQRISNIAFTSLKKI